MIQWVDPTESNENIIRFEARNVEIAVLQVEIDTFLEICFSSTDFSSLCDSNMHSTTYICGFRWFTEKKGSSCLCCEKLERILIFSDFSDHFTSFRAVRLQNSLQQTIIVKTPKPNFHAFLPPLHTLSLPPQSPLNPQHHTPTPPFASIHRLTPPPLPPLQPLLPPHQQVYVLHTITPCIE